MCVCFQMEEVPGELTQDDLSPDDVMILGTWNQVSLLPSPRLCGPSFFVTSLPVWFSRCLFGSGAKPWRKRRRRQWRQVRADHRVVLIVVCRWRCSGGWRCVVCPAGRYIESDPADRDLGIPVAVVKQGFEPPTFTGWFLGWNRDYWNSA